MLQQNEQALKEYHTEFYRMYRATPKENFAGEFEEIRLTKARDGLSVLSVVKDGEEIRLNSAFRPAKEAEKWAAQFELKYLENVLIMFGLGNGMFARAMLARMREGDRLLIHEPSGQIFETVMEQEDLSDILSDTRVRLSVEAVAKTGFYFNLEGVMDWKNRDSLKSCTQRAYAMLFLPQYNSWAKEIEECVHLIDINTATEAHFAQAQSRFTIRSLAQLEKSSLLSQCGPGIPKDLPAIIVSAGPSLDKNIDDLKKAEGKAFILATDSAVNTLLDHDIAFDAMITIDTLKNPAHISRPECQKIPLFCDFASNYMILKFHQGKKIWVRPTGYLTALYEKFGYALEEINLGGCVANAAFSICNAMGFKTIILVGQDLAYMGDITHAGGKKKNIINEQDGLKQIEGIDGSMVKSRYDWLVYLDWFEGAIEQLPQCKVIDATEGGALIHGSEVLKLSEAISRYCVQEFSMRSYLESVPPRFTEEEYPLVLEKTRNIKNEVKNVEREARDAIILCDEVLDEVAQLGSSVKAGRVSKRLSAINTRMAAQPVYDLLDNFITDMAVKELKNVNRAVDNDEEGLTETYSMAKVMYQALLDAAEILCGESIAELFKELDGEI